MKKILFLFISLVGFSFVGVGDVYAAWEGEIKCCQTSPPKQCQTQSTGETSSETECESTLTIIENALTAGGYDDCTITQTCTEVNSDNECEEAGYSCVENDECGGATKNLACDDGFQICCDESGDSCTGGSCMTEDECSDADGTPDTSCTECGAGQVYCVTGGGGGPGPGGGAASIDFANPLKYDTVQEVVSALLAALQGIIVLLSIVFIVIGAVLYITSGGNQGMVTLAKGAILASMIGLAIGIAAPSFLKEIYDILIGVDDPPICDPDNPPGPGDPICVPDEVESSTPILDILMNTLNFLLAIIGVLFLIMLTVGGIMYLFSGGDQTRIDTGKKMVTFSLIGISIALAALLLVRQIALFFG